jgi:hypothetical protein
MVRLLGLDVDGTVVRRDGQVDERDRAAIARLQRRGVPVTLVTGRLWAGTRDLAKDLALDAPALACADGAEIVDPRTGREIALRGIRGEVAETVRAVLGETGLAPFLMVAEGILHDASGDRYARYVKNWSPELARVPDCASHASWRSERGIYTLVAVGADEQVGRAAARLRATDALEVAEFGVAGSWVGEGAEPTRALMLHARGVHKGSALAEVARISGVELAEVAVVGDWINDIDMFRVAGRSFAMAQAPAAVREAASDVLAASSKEGGGVAEAIERILDEA